MFRKKVLIHFALVLSLLNGATLPAQAQGPLDPPNGYTVEQWNFMNQRHIQKISALLNAVHAPEDYDRYFASSLNATDRAYLMSVVGKIKSFPRVKRTGSTLILEAGGKTVRIEWPDVREPKVKVNGLDWTYDPGKPFKDQAEYLVKRLEANNKFSALEMLFFPKAHAAIVLAPWAVQLLIATLGTVAAYYSAKEGTKSAKAALIEECQRDLKKDPYNQTRIAQCQEYVDGLKKSPAIDAPRSQSIKRLKAGNGRNTIAVFSEVKEIDGKRTARICPSDFTKKELVYLATVCKTDPENESECAKDPTTGKPDYFKIHAKWDAESGDPKVWTVTDADVDPTKPNARARLKMHFDGDAFQCLTLPNDEFPKKGLQYHEPVCRVIVKPGDTKLKDAFKEADEIFAFTESKTTTCVDDKVEVNKITGQETTAPGAVKPAGDTTKDDGAKTLN